MSNEQPPHPNKPSQGGHKPVGLRSSSLQSLVRPSVLASGSARGSAPRPSVPTPVPSRGSVPGVAAQAQAKPAAKPKASFRFTPLKPTTPPRDAFFQPGRPEPSRGTPAAGMSIQNLLAHKLAASQADTVALHARPRGPIRTALTTSLQTKMQQFEEMKKKRVGGKSRDILELSWAPEGKNKDAYTPISLPYVIREDAFSGSKATDDAKKTQRPTIKNVDETNRNAAALFEYDEGLDDVHEWIMVQFPSIMPALDKEKMTAQKEHLEDKLLSEAERGRKLEERQRERRRRTTMTASSLLDSKTGDQYMHATLSGLPEGQLGKIVVRKSGKAQLLIGNHVFEVNQGSDCNFAQEVGCHLQSNSEFLFLGRCLKRMTVTPGMTRLIQSHEHHG